MIRAFSGNFLESRRIAGSNPASRKAVVSKATVKRSAFYFPRKLFLKPSKSLIRDYEKERRRRASLSKVPDCLRGAIPE